jgi:dethiobiotin synthetase
VALESAGVGKQLSARAKLGVINKTVLEIRAIAANALTLLILPAYSLDESSLFQQVG